MNGSRKFAQIVPVICGFLLSSGIVVAKESQICKKEKWLTKADYGSDGRIGPGRYVFSARSHSKFDVELVGAGGGGGGTTAGDHPKWGAGGEKGEMKRWLAFRPGRDWGVRPVHGNAGGESAIRRCASGFTVIHALGGNGGSGDSFDRISSDHAGPGEDLTDPETHTPVGRGGAGGGGRKVDMTPAVGVRVEVARVDTLVSRQVVVVATAMRV
jgi:hypothetical protein